ncbi:hypothetical protein DPMN_041323 [Dreissena polymorpha]|uniref:Uncharacterized protein n=1 Tax=Dreissena polymorpha TaxID=45954 RepID=A0A9D4HVX1_DREPO|nr:hypothetical protein DPMN_041323 [Dreissena polymorpha]
MNRKQIAFAINVLHLDIDMAQNAEAVVELLDDMHRAKPKDPIGNKCLHFHGLTSTARSEKKKEVVDKRLAFKTARLLVLDGGDRLFPRHG